MSSMSLKDWNDRVLDMVQALWGNVSPNFRMVAIRHENSAWVLAFVLEQESEVDRDAIEEIATDFESLQDSGYPFVVEIEVNSRALSWPGNETRVVFRRREEDVI